MREYPFELAVCAALEADSDGVVARQLGTPDRIVDVVVVAPGPEFDRRTEITAEAIPPAAVESDVGVGRARRPAAAIDAAPERAASVADRAIEVGFFEAERRGGSRYVRRATRYPEWIGGLHAIENKPDLDRPGELALQLRKDVSLALFDTVTLATASHVTGAHLNRLPDPVGVRRFDPETGDFETVREAERLSVSAPGLAITDTAPARVDVEPLTAAEKARLRRAVAERAYGKGWRPDSLPACARVSPGGPPFADDALPACAWKGRLVDPARECGPECPGHERADPPAIDPEANRAERSGWARDPAGVTRRQAGIDRFTGGEEPTDS